MPLALTNQASCSGRQFCNRAQPAKTPSGKPHLHAGMGFYLFVSDRSSAVSVQVHRLLEDDLAERKEHGRPPFIPSSKHILNPLSLWVRFGPRTEPDITHGAAEHAPASLCAVPVAECKIMKLASSSLHCCKRQCDRCIELSQLQVKYWDLWMGLQLLFTALVTPYQVAYLVTRLDGGSAPVALRTDATDEMRPCCLKLSVRIQAHLRPKAA